jgi:hypothetical protein
MDDIRSKNDVMCDDYPKRIDQLEYELQQKMRQISQNESDLFGLT